MSLRQQLHIINVTWDLKSLCTQPSRDKSQRFSSLQMGLKTLEGLQCAVCQGTEVNICQRCKTSAKAFPENVDLYSERGQAEPSSEKQRVLTLQNQQSLFINNKCKYLSLSHWSLSPFLLSSFLFHFVIFLCLLTFSLSLSIYTLYPPNTWLS